MDPFSIEDLKRGAKVVGAHCILLPAATYPAHIRGLGGRSIDIAEQMALEILEAVRIAREECGL